MVTMREALRWAVPFFLATSCYFLMRALRRAAHPQIVLRDRVRRLLPPLVVWSVIYLMAKAVLAAMTGDDAGLRDVLDDPTRLVMLGGAGVQLYYLPMLLVFVPVGWLVHTATRHSRLMALALSAASIALAWWATWSNNSYVIADAVAFTGLTDPADMGPIARVVLVTTAWAIRLLPFLALSAVLIDFDVMKHLRPAMAVVGLAVVVVLMVLARPVEASAPWELLAAFSLLIAGSAVKSAGNGPFARLIGVLAELSFAVFLVHVAVLQGVQYIGKTLGAGDPDQPTVGFVIGTWLATFAISCAVSIPIRRVAFSRRWLLGEDA
jgi:surface polysaccharide O-acyltransferase-like enzyme